MIKFFGIILTLFCVIGFSTLLYAGGAVTTQKKETASETASEIASYRLEIGNKVERGSKNILFGWTEIPKRVVDITKESKNPIWGLVAGMYQGTLKAMARTTSGISDVISAPVNPSKGPLVQAEINVE